MGTRMNRLSRRMWLVLMLGVLTSGVAVAAFTYWSQPLPLLVKLKGVDAVLINTSPASSQNNPPDINTPAIAWTRTDTADMSWGGFSDDHHYTIVLATRTLTQIDSGYLQVVLGGIPSYLSMNITSVKVYSHTQGTSWSGPTLVKTLATNIAFNSSVAWVKSDLIWQPSTDVRQYVVIVISEYQVSTTSDATKTLNPTVVIGQ